MTKKTNFMGFMSAMPNKAKPLENADSDSRFARPKDFALELSFEEHMKRIWKRNAVSMDKLSK